MTIKHFRVFITICECGSSTKAAEKLHLTQPAVSRAIREMEEYYHVQLFERKKQRLSLSECGRQIYPEARQVVQDFDLLEKTLHAWNQENILSIGANMSMGELSLTLLTRLMKEKFPELDIRVRIAPQEELCRLLSSNELDIALMGKHPDGDQFSSRQLSVDHYVAVLPVDHPLTGKKAVDLSELLAYPYYSREIGSACRSTVDSALEAAGLSVAARAESCSTHYLVHVVMRGEGVTILPERVVRDEARRGMVALRPIQDLDLSEDTFIVWRKARHLTPAMHAMIDLLRRTASQDLTED